MSEIAKLVEQAKEASKALHSHHYMWMIEAALETMRENIAEQEGRILRHERFKDEPYLEVGSDFGAGDRYTREERVQQARRDLEQYRNIVRFLIALKKLFTEQEAIRFARDFAASFVSKRGKS